MKLFRGPIKAIAEGNNAVNENTQKLDKFIGKMESYFGGGAGLEYETRQRAPSMFLRITVRGLGRVP